MTYDWIVSAIGPFELTEYLGVVAAYRGPRDHGSAHEPSRPRTRAHRGGAMAIVMSTDIQILPCNTLYSSSN